MKEAKEAKIAEKQQKSRAAPDDQQENWAEKDPEEKWAQWEKKYRKQGLSEDEIARAADCKAGSRTGLEDWLSNIASAAVFYSCNSSQFFRAVCMTRGEGQMFGQTSAGEISIVSALI